MYDKFAYVTVICFQGISLEKRLGGGYFLYMLAVFTLLCNVTTVGLGFAAEYLLHDPSYLSQCAVGFSGDGQFSGHNAPIASSLNLVDRNHTETHP